MPLEKDDLPPFTINLCREVAQIDACSPRLDARIPPFQFQKGLLEVIADKVEGFFEENILIMVGKFSGDSQVACARSSCC